MTDYTKLVQALRHCMTKEDGITICEPCPYYGKGIECENVLHTDAAAAIEELQAQLPKRGKWIVKGANRIDCSVCGHSICFAFGLIEGSLTGYNYCPNCGAKMGGMDADRPD